MSKRCNKNSQCDQKYVKSIMKSEADIAKCLTDMLCDFENNISQVEPLDKRAILIDKVVCAYACKEKSMAKLVEALAKKTDSNRPLCKVPIHERHPNRKNNNTPIIVLLILALFSMNTGFNCCRW